ncbi:MAG TPA: hypothetical protein VHH88_10200 [Verrucomicrobiae bacterium]|nr:hypothetical protein [Verrucomicrobiae bacterium]
MKSIWLLLQSASLLLLPIAARAEIRSSEALTFCCSSTNDLFVALRGSKYKRHDSPLAAMQRAKPGAAVLILADGYPERFTSLTTKEWNVAREKNLRLFIEYPKAIPGMEIGPAQSTQWERGVAASGIFEKEMAKLGAGSTQEAARGYARPTASAGLAKLRIVAIHDCHYVSMAAKDPWLVIARVAGFDSAVFGLPTNAAPILFEKGNLLVATTKLSGFVTARFAPTQDWEIIWQKILARLDPDHSPHRLRWTPTVEPAFGPAAKLPRHFQRTAFDTAADWIFKSRLLVDATRMKEIQEALAQGQETCDMPSAGAPEGDGSLGILEGYASGILHDGLQKQRLPLRADCNTTSAMVLALDSWLNRDHRFAAVSKNLLNYVYFHSGMCGGPRADPTNSAYGLIGWGAISPAWLVANYGDDNANAILATLVAEASLRDHRWDEPVMRALLANLRTTGRLGFRGDRIDIPALEQHGWKYFHDASPVNYSPHFEAMLWACNLWAFHQTGYHPFLEKATNAIAMTMKVYPQGWRWKNNLERAHMLLCLSWLVRVADTPEHREWLHRVASDLLRWQSASGAIYETLVGTGGGHYQVPQSNEAYGTTETPLIQKNGEPASDQLYTTGYALLGLQEAVGATGDEELRAAENKLAEFLCRIQIRSRRLPWLNGWWFRAFDDRRWEFWASSADVGWGAWSLEAGWGQAWTAAVLALREKKTTMWEVTKGSRIHDHFEHTREVMGLEP